MRILAGRGTKALTALRLLVHKALETARKEHAPPTSKVLDYTPSYSGFTRWRSNPNWPGRRAAAALRTAGKTRRMR